MSFDLVCRTCLQIISPETCRSIKEVENNSDILEMLSYSIPEMVTITTFFVVKLALTL